MEVPGTAQFFAPLIENAARPLTQSQRSLLVEIAKGKWELEDPEYVAAAIRAASNDDLNALIATRFVIRTADGEIKLHKVIGEYFSRQRQASAT